MDINICTALYTHHHSPILEYVHHPKMKCVPNLSHSFFSSPPAVSIIIGGDHSVHSLLSLATFTHHNDFEVHQYCSTYQYALLFSAK